MKKNIFPAKSQSIQELFSDAPSLEKILIVPVDCAKKSHTVQFCLGTGDLLLKKALTIYNTPAGLDYFLKRIDKISSRYHIKRENVLIVSEVYHGGLVRMALKNIHPLNFYAHTKSTKSTKSTKIIIWSHTFPAKKRNLSPTFLHFRFHFVHYIFVSLPERALQTSELRK